MPADLDQKRLRELALRAARTGRPQYTRFLEPSMLEQVRRAAGESGAGCALWGGYPGAERVMAAYWADEAPPFEDFPLCAIRVSWNARFADPGHRELMGAVMGLGIERDAVGDVAMGVWREAPCAWVFATQEMAGYIAANLVGAGRAAVSAQVTRDAPAVEPPKGARLRVTVQNERLDAVLAAGYRLSRAEAQRLIAAGLVKLNHLPSTRSDARVGEGDLISARGYGRLKVEAFMGESRRGRHVLELFRYGK